MDYRNRCGQIFNSGFIQLEPVLNVIILILQQLSKKRLNKSPGTLPRLLFFVFLYPIAFYFLFSGFSCIVTFPNTNCLRLSSTIALSSIMASLYPLASRTIITMACKTFFIASPFLWLRGTVIFAIICKQLVAYICDLGSSFSLACLHLYARRINCNITHHLLRILLHASSFPYPKSIHLFSRKVPHPTQKQYSLFRSRVWRNARFYIPPASSFSIN